jgi:hypothetical protein
MHDSSWSRDGISRYARFSAGSTLKSPANVGPGSVYGVVAIALTLLAGCATRLPKAPDAPDIELIAPTVEPTKPVIVKSAPPPPPVSTSPPGDSSGGTPPAAEAGKSGEQAAQANAGAHPPVSYITITPLSTLSHDRADSVDVSYQARYTRLIIGGETFGDTGNAPPAPPVEVLKYGYDQRNWLTRFFIGKHTSTNLTIKVTAGAFVATVPLVSIDHVSTKSDGESFNRIVYHQAQSFPLFLIKRNGSNGVVSIKSTVKVNDQIQSGAAGAALEVAQGVARFVAPQSAVLTTLTEQNTKNAATAIDQAVNKLFSASVDEEQWNDGDIRRWGHGVDLQFRIPAKEGKFPKTKDDMGKVTLPIGRWNIGFATPRWSIFSDIEVCPGKSGKGTSTNAKAGGKGSSADDKGASADANTPSCLAGLELTSSAKDLAGKLHVQAADVLSFKLSDSGNDLGTVEAYIKKQDWYTSKLMTFSATTPAPKDTDFSAFCKSIQSSIAAIDLNEIDQRIVTYAVVTGLSLPGMDSEAFKKATACQ